MVEWIHEEIIDIKLSKALVESYGKIASAIKHEGMIRLLN
jgi:hypothetical protein